MATIYQPLCDLCDNREICKYTETYNQMFTKIRGIKHPLFEYKLTCNKFKDSRTQYSCTNDCTSVTSVIR